MQKITYENYLNGLSATISNDNPREFLAAFDGSSTPCTAIAYKPAEFDGQRFISANLDARTITFTAEWYGVDDGKFSVKKSYEKWEELQKVFIPGTMGKLTWTNGEKTRFIECRTEETPKLSRVCGCKLSAEFKLIADYPYWQGDEHELVFDGIFDAVKIFEIFNPCGLPVPFVFRCTEPYLMIGLVGSGDSETFIEMNMKRSSGLSGTLVVDTKNCTVTIDGEPANQFLSPQSCFFKIPPGTVNLATVFLGAETATISAGTRITWRDHYLGVS